MQNFKLHFSKQNIKTTFKEIQRAILEQSYFLDAKINIFAIVTLTLLP